MSKTKKAITITVDLGTFHELEQIAAYHHVTRSALVQIALNEYCKREGARIEQDSPKLGAW